MVRHTSAGDAGLPRSVYTFTHGVGLMRHIYIYKIAQSCCLRDLVAMVGLDVHEVLMYIHNMYIYAFLWWAYCK